MKTYYVIYKGIKTGIFNSFNDIKPLIKTPGTMYKSFNTLYEATEYLNNGPLASMAQLAQVLPKKSPLAPLAPPAPPVPQTKLENLINEYNSLNKNNNDLYIYTDGSVKGNGKKTAQGGFGVFFSDKNIKPYSQILDNKLNIITSPYAELSGILSALKTIDSIKSKNKNIYLYTDSEYCLNALTKWYKSWVKNNWIKADKSQVKNKDEILEIVDYINKYNVKLIHINSHTGKKDIHSIGNDIADVLSKCY
jgi:ribonuclease HI